MQTYIIQFKGWDFLLLCARDYLSQLQIISQYKLSSSYHPTVLPFHIIHVMLKSKAIKFKPLNKSPFGWQHMVCVGWGFLKHSQIYHCQRLASQLLLSWWLWCLKLIGNYALDKIWDCKREAQPKQAVVHQSRARFQQPVLHVYHADWSHPEVKTYTLRYARPKDDG